MKALGDKTFSSFMLKRNFLLLLSLLFGVTLTAQADVPLPKKGMVFHYAPYPRGVDFENPGELLDDVKLLHMLQYDWQRDSTWKAARQRHSSDDTGFRFEQLYMVDTDVSFAKAGAKQTLYLNFNIKSGDDYEGPVAFVRRGDDPSKWYFPFRYNDDREVKIDGKAQPGDSVVCHAELHLVKPYQDLTKILIEMDKQDGKTTIYFADTALVFYNTARTDAEKELNRFVFCPFDKGHMEEVVFWNRHLTEKEKQEVMSRSTWKDEYTLPEPQVIKTQMTEQESDDKQWRGHSWVMAAFCVLLAVIALVVRGKANLQVPYTYIGSNTVFMLFVFGTAVYGYNLVRDHDADLMTIVWMVVYAIIILLTYMLVSFVPDLYGDLEQKNNSGILAKANMLPGCLKFVIWVIVLWIAYIAGQIMFVILPFFTIYMFVRNLWITKEVIADIKSNQN